MSFMVYLNAFDKRKNSTAQPDPSQNVQYRFQADLKDDCTIDAPTIKVIVADDQYLFMVNMAYIPKFRRYYFIKDISYYRGEWTLHLVCDVLASFRSEILSSSKFVIRSASNNDGKIIDQMCPTTQRASFSRVTFNSGMAGSVPGGRFILGVRGRHPADAAVFPGIAYYCLTVSQMVVICNQFFSDSILSEITDIQESLMRALFDPTQYISSCVYSPFIPSSVSTGARLRFGWWELDGSYNILNTNSGSCTYEATFTINVPTHPQAATHGDFLRLSPYSKYILYYPGFGTVPIPSEYVYQGQVILIINYDFITGVASIRVMPVGDANNGVTQCVTIATAQIGVPIPLGSGGSSVSGLVSAAGSAVGGIASAVTGNIGGVFTGALSSIGSLLESAPSGKSTGAQGSFATVLNVGAWIDCKFQYVTNISAQENGRPYMTQTVLSALSGFCVVSDGNVRCWAYASEHEQIKSYLESGFFIE